MTGNDHEHRKHWIRDRLEQLASVFAIDICGYTATNKPEEVRKWQAERAKYPEGKPTEKK
jgi:hypothetical protein